MLTIHHLATEYTRHSTGHTTTGIFTVTLTAVGEAFDHYTDHTQRLTDAFREAVETGDYAPPVEVDTIDVEDVSWTPEQITGTIFTSFFEYN